MRWYFVLRTERLPRQARDQHRVNSHTGCVFLQGVKRKYIRAYQFAYSRIDEVEGDPTSHTARGVIASNLRGEVPENVVVTAHACTHATGRLAGWLEGASSSLLCFLACLLHRGCPLLSCADVFVSDAVPLRARACVFMGCLYVVVSAHHATLVHDSYDRTSCLRRAL